MHGVTSHKKQIGDCEIGRFCNNATNVEVTKEHGNILMCAVCKAEEERIEAQNTAAKAFVEHFKQVDASINTKQDVFNAKTKAAIEAYDAIKRNSEIPESEKEESFTKVCEERFKHFKSVVFDIQNTLKDAQNEMTMWQTQGQMSAGKLRADAREKYKLFDLHYHPEPVKKIKPVKTPTPKVSGKEQTKLAREAAAKYGLDYILVHMAATSQNITPEAAAKQLAEARDRMKSLTVKKDEN